MLFTCLGFNANLPLQLGTSQPHYKLGYLIGQPLQNNNLQSEDKLEGGREVTSKYKGKYKGKTSYL